MRRRFGPGRWLWLAPGALLFLLVFLSVLTYTLPGDVILSSVRTSLARAGLTISSESARTEFPLAFRMDNATIGRPGGGKLLLDTVRASWEWTGLLRWLPVHVTVSKGNATAEVRTSPRFWNPGKGRLSLASLSSEDLAPLIPISASGAGFDLDSAGVRWKRTASGNMTGTGTGRFAWVRVPIPEPSSPIREALLRDVTILFALREGSLIVSSFTATYEGARVEGTGEIAGVFTPSRSAITFHLKIENPLEGKVGALFDLLAKNAKNANLRITGTLLSPKGEFRFF
ncbi:MAG: type II secretion system protein GspN [Candidatus Deferrimicrobiaceae bacterium]